MGTEYVLRSTCDHCGAFTFYEGSEPPHADQILPRGWLYIRSYSGPRVFCSTDCARAVLAQEQEVAARGAAEATRQRYEEAIAAAERGEAQQPHMTIGRRFA